MDKLSEVYKIIKTIKTIRETLKKSFERPFKDLNLTAPQSFLLGILLHKGTQRITELSKKMGLSNSTVSGIVDRLEMHGAVERKKDSNDKRIIWVDIQNNYKIKMQDKLFNHEEYMKNLLNDATEEEIQAILLGFETFKKVLERNHTDV